MTSSPLASKAELRRQQSNQRRLQVASEVVAAEPVVLPRQRLPAPAQALLRALPAPLLEQGLVAFDQQGQPRVASYDPSLLSPNPQRGRVVDRQLDELATSLDVHGQQEPILARLITDTDRRRWPDAFTDRQVLLILKGHRIHKAQPQTKLRMLRVELLLPQEGEDDLVYGRRALRRSSIRMMHSQGYDIFDKVHLFEVWKEEFSLEGPKDGEVAAFFDISRSEAQRLKVVAELDREVAQDIINADRRPADEVVFHIANRPPDEHRGAYERLGDLTVAQVRRTLEEERTPPAAKVAGPGRPRNYVLAVRSEDADITYVSTSLTPQQWRAKGGARAFWKAIQAMGNTREIQDRLRHDLG